MYLSRTELDPARRSTMIALTSPQKFHGAVENSFSGERRRRLWRLDRLNGKLYLLLLSEELPDLTGLCAQFGTGAAPETRRYEPLLERVTPGSCWQFRLTANPTRTRKDPADPLARGALKPCYLEAEQEQWLLEQAGKHGFALTEGAFQVTRKQTCHFRKNGKRPVTLLAVTYEGIPVVTDDNYAALKVDAIGCQAGADLSTFSCFKILGPEGVGAVIGSKELIDRIYKMQYSGGSQVQGHEAMEALRGLIYAPVALAIQSEVNEELVRRLNAGEIPHVRQAFLANAQSKVLLVEFDQEIAEKILDAAPKFGAAPHPVGSESKYEFAPMIYRVSGTFRAQDPTIEHRMIRINPMRSGPDTIIRILRSCMEQVEEN